MIGYPVKQKRDSAIQCKECTVCGQRILWRRRLAANWETMQYCSAACRRISASGAGGGQKARAESRERLEDGSVASAA
jgi:hypothetical protein